MANIDEINELVGNKNFEEAEKLIKTALEEEVDNPELVKLILAIIYQRKMLT